MVFHYIVALQKLHHEPYPGWKESSGIACGPLGNNCAVEGSGNRGPGPLPLPGRVQAKFRGVSGSHDGDHSLFDLHSARLAISGKSVSHVLPPSQRGYGKVAYNPTPNPLYSVSHLGQSVHGSVNSSHQATNSFYGGMSKPPHTVDVTSMWGQNSHGDQGQFSGSALVSQSNGSVFHLSLHEGVVNMASVSVVSHATGKSGHGSKFGSYSWDVNRTSVSTRPEHSSDKIATNLTPYWSLSNNTSAEKIGHLAPEPFTQYAATSPQGYSSI